MSKHIIVKMGTAKEALEQFKLIWQKTEKGHPPKESLEILRFEDSKTLIKTLTLKRLDLLQKIHAMGKISIRHLAKELGRDYKNVYQNVQVLRHVGLVIGDKKDGLYEVPWDVITAEFPMTKAA